ncbi:variable large family protein [Borrelia turicatae]|uniref:variable large family protein n=1 Tax=Borrelia turicatae TaxID=142 RepID=UPI001FF675A2|nr:variable large family protein [Borrelia turicatae]UPA14183.1 variable large family protein [Borrelia turicatae 91E135]
MKHRLNERIKNFNITILISLFLLISCGSGQLQAEKLAAESKISFFDSLIKIGQGFQEIFGNAIGDILGFSAVKSTDSKSKVGEHLNKVKKGLEDTKTKLNDLSGKISEVTSADGNTIEAVKSVIKGTGEVFDKLIASVTKLAGVTNDGTAIGDTANADASAPANKDSVEAIIVGVKEIIDVADKSGIKIEAGNAGSPVANGAGTATATINANAAAGAGAGPKLSDEVAKADPWAMIAKIKDAKTKTEQLTAGADNNAGELATGANAADANGAKAATNADLAAAVALKAMTQGGKLSANAANNEADAVKAAAVSAVNKVLGVLDFIIRKTVSSQLEKIREAVKGIQYSETTAEASEAGTDK